MYTVLSFCVHTSMHQSVTQDVYHSVADMQLKCHLPPFFHHMLVGSSSYQHVTETVSFLFIVFVLLEDKTNADGGQVI